MGEGGTEKYEKSFGWEMLQGRDVGMGHGEWMDLTDKAKVQLAFVNIVTNFWIHARMKFLGLVVIINCAENDPVSYI